MQEQAGWRKQQQQKQGDVYIFLYNDGDDQTM